MKAARSPITQLAVDHFTLLLYVRTCPLEVQTTIDLTNAN